MKLQKTRPLEVTLYYTEVFQGKTTQKFFKTDSKTAKGHLQLMKNNPYVKDVRTSKVI